MHIVDLFDRGARGFPKRLAFCGAGGGDQRCGRFSSWIPLAESSSSSRSPALIWSESPEDVEDLSRDTRVEGHVPANEDELRAEPARLDRRHGGAHTEAPRLIAGGRHHAAIAFTPDGHRFPAQLGPLVLLYGSEEGIHVGVKDAPLLVTHRRIPGGASTRSSVVGQIASVFESVVLSHGLLHLPGTGHALRESHQVASTRVDRLAPVRRDDHVSLQEVAGPARVVVPGELGLLLCPDGPASDSLVPQLRLVGLADDLDLAYRRSSLAQSMPQPHVGISRRVRDPPGQRSDSTERVARSSCRHWPWRRPDPRVAGLVRRSRCSPETFSSMRPHRMGRPLNANCRIPDRFKKGLAARGSGVVSRGKKALDGPS